MGRWTQYDEDDYRLPEGMKRIGYDADSGRYYFRGSDGNIWQGAVGAQFGELTEVNSLPASVALEGASDDDQCGDDLEASPRIRNGNYMLLSEDHSQPIIPRTTVNVGSYRTLFPFFLIIAVVLLLIWRLIVSPGLSTPTKKCPEGTSSHWIQPGDNCWELSRQHGWTLEKFKEANPKVVCDPITPGTSVCLPPLKKTQRRRL
jgi:hypothetical protein